MTALPGRTWAAVLRAAAFLSGAAALVFETLMFRQAGLLLGNAVWSSSIVLASFMAGLAIGNSLAGGRGGRLRRPLRAYAALELTVGLAGAAVVTGLPVLVPIMVPALHAAVASAPALMALRTALAFVLLVVPASAMGATLPVLVAALSRREGGFGWTLGQLYGWNTLGAVAGALAGEMLLIAAVGVKGTALAALAMNGAAALIAWRLDRAAGPTEAAPEAAAAGPTAWPALVAAFLAGAILLALEVVWFRFLLLTVVGTSSAFAAMLAIVLLGIALGGLAASRWARRWPGAGRHVAALALLAGVCTLLSYAGFQQALRPLHGRAAVTTSQVFGLAVPLMLPTCFVSGLLFTLLGEVVRRNSADDARAAGLLTLANTLGALMGALMGGFVLLPGLGIERALYVAGLAYMGVAVAGLLAVRDGALPAGTRVWLASAAAGYLLAVAFFPFGLMARRYLLTAIVRWVDLRAPGSEVVAVREGLTETVMVTRLSRWGRPVSFRLLTNAISMSAWDQSGTRYMRAFVYLPLALNPQARRALLISYGVGVTAKTLTEEPSLQAIDVVDVSRDIIAATRAVYPSPGEHPLQDARVRLHIEDGRFFLLSRADTYDVITAEPPPPVSAGITALYSREYFQLLRSRLAEGGVASYWLPVYQMAERDSQAIAAAFCAAFPDCSLWQGWGAEWILLGTRNARPPGEAAFGRQWLEARPRWELQAMALERPEDLGTLFLGDAAFLAEWTRGVPPLDDDHPHRVRPQVLNAPAPYVALAQPGRARERFARSELIRRLWPAAVRQRTLAAFEQHEPVLRLGWASYGVSGGGLADLHEVLTRTALRTPVLWLMGSDALVEQAALAARARGVDEPLLDEALGIGAMADRDYRRAEASFARAQRRNGGAEHLAQWRVLALCADGQRAAAARLLAREAARLQPAASEDWSWLASACGAPAVPAAAAAPP